VPDGLTDRPGPATDGAAALVPAPQMDGAGSRPHRRPSWLRAALLSLAIVAAGAALGGAGYRFERGHSVPPPSIERTDHGWIITGRQNHDFSGLGLNDTRLVWQDGASIEYADLTDGAIRLLGPGPGMRTTWDPAVGPRYAVWFEAERQASIAAQAVAYDTQTGRRWTVAEVGSARSYPAISGDVAVWCSALQLGEPSINGVRVGTRETFDVAVGDGAPVVSGGLVVWATSWTGPFMAGEIGSKTTWPVAAGLTDGRLTGLALAGRVLVWGQSQPAAGTGMVAAVDVDGGGTTTVAGGLSGLAGPAYDGRTVVWAERVGDSPQAPRSSHPYAGFRVMGRRLGGGPAFLIAEVANPVSEVAVSGDVVAWISSWSGQDYQIETAMLPR
jgi:hypothetical protein